MITSTLIITVIVAILMLVYRAEIRKLVNWVTSFKRVARTSEGFSIESREPDVAPVQLEKREEVALARQVTEIKQLPAGEKHEEAQPEKWSRALSEKRYDDAIRLLGDEISKEEDPEKLLLKKSVLGYIKFEKDVGEGVTYFEKLISESPQAYQPYEWFALSYYWRGLNENALPVVERGLQSSQKKFSLLDLKTDCLIVMVRETEAIAVANETIKCDPSAPSGYLNLARI